MREEREKDKIALSQRMIEEEIKKERKRDIF